MTLAGCLVEPAWTWVWVGNWLLNATTPWEKEFQHNSHFTSLGAASFQNPAKVPKFQTTNCQAENLQFRGPNLKKLRSLKDKNNPCTCWTPGFPSMHWVSENLRRCHQLPNTICLVVSMVARLETKVKCTLTSRQWAWLSKQGLCLGYRFHILCLSPQLSN